MPETIWEMQQAAERRVQQMRERSRLLLNGELPEQGRSAQTIAAGRPPARTVPVPARACTDSGRGTFTPARTEPDKAPAPSDGTPEDRDRLFLLMLAVLLLRNGARLDIVIALLYLAM